MCALRLPRYKGELYAYRRWGRLFLIRLRTQRSRMCLKNALSVSESPQGYRR